MITLTWSVLSFSLLYAIWATWRCCYNREGWLDILEEFITLFVYTLVASVVVVWMVFMLLLPFT